jgi:stearoyl-CoA desaturase (delta-9 desaturase)
VPARVADLGVWLLTSLNPAEWVRVHRIHHRFADGPLDPHAPLRHGAVRLLVGIPIVYRRYRAAHAAEIAAAASDLGPRYGSAPWRTSSPAFQALRRSALTALLALALGGGWPSGVVASAAQLVSYSVLLGYVTVAGHRMPGRRPGRPVNRRLSAVLLLGTGLHANHHARPRSASQRRRRGEVDTGWLALRGLAALGLVTVTVAAGPPPPPFDARDRNWPPRPPSP